jgi:DNA-binding FrmR family transcriptional regulator
MADVLEEDQEVVRRLRKIEGQVKGLQKMIEEGRECEQVLTQVLAARAALDQVALRLVRTHIGDCLVSLPPEKAKANIGRALELIARRS